MPSHLMRTNKGGKHKTSPLHSVRKLSSTENLPQNQERRDDDDCTHSRSSTFSLSLEKAPAVASSAQSLSVEKLLHKWHRSNIGGRWRETAAVRVEKKVDIQSIRLKTTTADSRFSRQILACNGVSCLIALGDEVYRMVEDAQSNAGGGNEEDRDKREGSKQNIANTKERASSWRFVRVYLLHEAPVSTSAASVSTPSLYARVEWRALVWGEGGEREYLVGYGGDADSDCQSEQQQKKGRVYLLRYDQKAHDLRIVSSKLWERRNDQSHVVRVSLRVVRRGDDVKAVVALMRAESCAIFYFDISKDGQHSHRSRDGELNLQLLHTLHLPEVSSSPSLSRSALIQVTDEMCDVSIGDIPSRDLLVIAVGTLSGDLLLSIISLSVSAKATSSSSMQSEGIEWKQNLILSSIVSRLSATSMRSIASSNYRVLSSPSVSASAVRCVVANPHLGYRHLLAIGCDDGVVRLIDLGKVIFPCLRSKVQYVRAAALARSVVLQCAQHAAPITSLCWTMSHVGALMSSSLEAKARVLVASSQWSNAGETRLEMSFEASGIAPLGSTCHLLSTPDLSKLFIVSLQGGPNNSSTTSAGVGTSLIKATHVDTTDWSIFDHPYQGIESYAFRQSIGFLASRSIKKAVLSMIQDVTTMESSEMSEEYMRKTIEALRLFFPLPPPPEDVASSVEDDSVLRPLPFLSQLPTPPVRVLTDAGVSLASIDTLQRALERYERCLSLRLSDDEYLTSEEGQRAVVEALNDAEGGPLTLNTVVVIARMFRHLYSLASSASAAYAVDQQEILKVLARILRKVEDKHVMAIVAVTASVTLDGIWNDQSTPPVRSHTHSRFSDEDYALKRHIIDYLSEEFGSRSKCLFQIALMRWDVRLRESERRRHGFDSEPPPDISSFLDGSKCTKKRGKNKSQRKESQLQRGLRRKTRSCFLGSPPMLPPSCSVLVRCLKQLVSERIWSECVSLLAKALVLTENVDMWYDTSNGNRSIPVKMAEVMGKGWKLRGTSRRTQLAQALHGFEGEEEEEREEEKEMFVLRIRFYDWVHKQPWMDEMQSALGHCRRTAEKNLRELRVGMGKSQSRAGAGKRHSGEGADDSLEWYVEALCDALCFLGWSDACDLLSHLLWEGSPAIAAPAPSVRPLISAERNDDTEEAEHEEQAEREEQHLQARWASMERRVRSAICDAEEFGREFVKSSMAMRTKVKTLFARANNSTDGSCIDLNADCASLSRKLEVVADQIQVEIDPLLSYPLSSRMQSVLSEVVEESARVRTLIQSISDMESEIEAQQADAISEARNETPLPHGEGNAVKLRSPHALAPSHLPTRHREDDAGESLLRTSLTASTSLKSSNSDLSAQETDSDKERASLAVLRRRRGSMIMQRASTTILDPEALKRLHEARDKTAAEAESSTEVNKSGSIGSSVLPLRKSTSSTTIDGDGKGLSVITPAQLARLRAAREAAIERQREASEMKNSDISGSSSFLLVSTEEKQSLSKKENRSKLRKSGTFAALKIGFGKKEKGTQDGDAESRGQPEKEDSKKEKRATKSERKIKTDDQEKDDRRAMMMMRALSQASPDSNDAKVERAARRERRKLRRSASERYAAQDHSAGIESSSSKVKHKTDELLRSASERHEVQDVTESSPSMIEDRTELKEAELSAGERGEDRDDGKQVQSKAWNRIERKKVQRAKSETYADCTDTKVGEKSTRDRRDRKKLECSESFVNDLSSEARVEGKQTKKTQTDVVGDDTQEKKSTKCLSSSRDASSEIASTVLAVSDEKKEAKKAAKKDKKDKKQRKEKTQKKHKIEKKDKDAKSKSRKRRELAT